MNSYATFLVKELVENLRAKRLLALVCVFMFFAVASPLLARYIGEFFALLMPAGDDDAAQALAAAFLGEPNWQESYAQFYGNIGQIGTLTVILLFMGTILREKRDGTADLVFTKGLSPSAFVLAKFTAAGLLTTATAVAAALVCHAYTLLLFGSGARTGHALLGALGLAVFLLMMLAVVTLCSALAKSAAASAIMGLFAFLAFGFTSVIPRFGRFSPGSLMASIPVETTLGGQAGDFAANVAVAAAMAALSLWGAARVTATR